MMADLIDFRHAASSLGPGKASITPRDTDRLALNCQRQALSIRITSY
jgi:hypothetical protein